MNLRTLVSARPRAAHRAAGRRPALFIGVATAGALMVNILSAGEPAAQADAEPTSVSVAAKLGISDAQSHAAIESDDRLLDELSASRSQREADQDAAAAAQAAAAAAQAAAEQAAADEAARVAAEQAAAAAAAQAEAAAARPGQGTGAAVAPAGSYQDYAMGKLGGDGSQFSCLENLWGKESGWNPNAQNPSSTAYGIAQFLDSTWAGTGIAKTSDGYRQIDAGLIYIEKAYGSPCDAWAHSQSTGWY